MGLDGFKKCEPCTKTESLVRKCEDFAKRARRLRKNARLVKKSTKPATKRASLVGKVGALCEHC